MLAVVGVAAVLASVLRTVVVPRAVPARLARAAFLVVSWLLRLRLRLTGRSDYVTRDRRSVRWVFGGLAVSLNGVPNMSSIANGPGLMPTVSITSVSPS